MEKRKTLRGKGGYCDINGQRLLCWQIHEDQKEIDGQGQALIPDGNDHIDAGGRKVSLGLKLSPSMKKGGRVSNYEDTSRGRPLKCPLVTISYCTE